MVSISALPTSYSRLRPLFENAGARWVELPVLYPADPFLETAGEDIRRRMFVTEGPGGERLALRPDFTIPVCLHHLGAGAPSDRYAYGGLVFRRHDTEAPERLETGFEDIGGLEPVAADAQAIALAVSAAASVSSEPLRVRLGDIGVFVALLAALGLPEPWRRRLRRSFGLPRVMEANLARLSAPRRDEDVRLDPSLRDAAERHDRYALVDVLQERLLSQGLGDGAGRSAAEIADRFLDQRALAEARIEPGALGALRRFLGLQSELEDAAAALRRFSAEHGVDLSEAIDSFSARALAISAAGSLAEFRYEAAFGRPLDYYTGLIFEVRGEGHAAPICGGGRYDRLMELLGAEGPIPAVGFTIRLDLAGLERRL